MVSHELTTSSSGREQSPRGRRLATDTWHRADTERGSAGPSLLIGGKERVGELRLTGITS